MDQALPPPRAAGIAQYKERLDSWYQDNLELINKASSQPTRTDDDFDTPGIDPTKFVSKDDFQRALLSTKSEVEQRSAALVSVLGNYQFKHFKDFQKVIDPTKLYELAAKKQITLDAAYAELTRDKQQELDNRRREEEKEKLTTEIRAKLEEEMLQRGARLPYLASNTEPSVLDGLSKAAENPNYGLQAAINEFYKNRSQTG